MIVTSPLFNMFYSYPPVYGTVKSEMRTENFQGHFHINNEHSMKGKTIDDILQGFPGNKIIVA